MYKELFTFIANAHKAGTRESTTRLQTSVVIFISCILLSAIVIVYLVNPSRFTEEPWALASVVAGVILTALTGKVVSSNVERRKYRGYDDFYDPNDYNPKTE